MKRATTTARGSVPSARQQAHHLLGQPHNVPPKTSWSCTSGTASAASCAWSAQQARGLRHRRAQLGGHHLSPDDEGALVHRQPGRRYGRRHAARRDQSCTQGRNEVRHALVRRRPGAYQRVRRRNAAGRPDPAGGGNHCPRRRHGPDLLHRQAVSRAVPRRAFQRPARQLEPHRAGGCAGDVHAVCGRWQRSVRRDGALRRRLAGRGNRRVLRPHRRCRAAQDGSLLVSDDTAGAIYRISYQGK